MNKSLLIEIGTEELPAIPFLNEFPNIKDKWKNVLEKNGLLCNFEFFYTPRRLVLWHKEFKIKQEDSVVEQFGPPVKIAYKDGIPTDAAISFASKLGIKVDNIEKITLQKGEVLYYKQNLKGAESRYLLNEMINEFVLSLNFGKSMKWGDKNDSFIRPIRNLCVMMDDEIIKVNLFLVNSSNYFFPHRMISSKPCFILNANEYFEKIKNNSIVLNQDDRKTIVLDQIRKIENKNDIKVELDIDLLNEVVAITEYPTALLGNFDEEFLQLPEEVIVTSMKENQRYFAVYKDDKLTNKFVVVSNSTTNDFSLIIKGNEKVLRPRLSDAMFFFNNDIKNGLSNDGLKKLVFVDGLGSMYDKCKREEQIALYLAKLLNYEDTKLLSRAVMISKADLMSEMVYEFTQLQGLMGYYYSKIANEDNLVSLALKEQYFPIGDDSSLPSNIFSSIVSLSNKLDNILSLFSISKIPTGSKDPFALRRAASGIIKISIEHKLPINISLIIENIGKNYNKIDKKVLINFFNERLFKIFDVNPTVLKSVLANDNNDFYEIYKKIHALNPIVQSSKFKEYSFTFKRLSNIIKDLNTNIPIIIDEKLLQENEEIELFKSFKLIQKKTYKNYDEHLKDLFNLKEKLDNFFDKILVNHKDMSIKNNRKNLIGIIYQEFKKIADIKEITI